MSKTWIGSYVITKPNLNELEILTGINSVQAMSREEALGKLFLLLTKDFPTKDGYSSPDIDVIPYPVTIHREEECT